MKTLVLETGPDGSPQYTPVFTAVDSRSVDRATLKSVEEGLRALRKTREKAGMSTADWKKGK